MFVSYQHYHHSLPILLSFATIIIINVYHHLSLFPTIICYSSPPYPPLPLSSFTIIIFIIPYHHSSYIIHHHHYSLFIIHNDHLSSVPTIIIIVHYNRLSFITTTICPSSRWSFAIHYHHHLPFITIIICHSLPSSFVTCRHYQLSFITTIICYSSPWCILLWIMKWYIHKQLSVRMQRLQRWCN